MSSRATGADAPKEAQAESETELTVPLVHARWRHFFWSLFGIGATLVLLSMGLVVLPVVVALLTARVLWEFVKTLRHPPGEIALAGETLAFAPALCAGSRVEVGLDAIENVYMLRRRVPWSSSGPVLVLETKRGVFEYPRDWFAKDSDQKRVASALNRRLGRL